MDRIAWLVGDLQRCVAHQFDASAFVQRAAEALERAAISAREIKSYIERRWDVSSPGNYWVDTDAPPFLIDLHLEPDWCLRSTIWDVDASAPWEDKPHNHFGFIATTAVSDVAYRENLYTSFEHAARGDSCSRILQRGTVHIITPDTIHAVVLSKDMVGITLSVRTRAVSDLTYEYDRATGRVVERTKSAQDRKLAVLDYLRHDTR